VTVHWLSFFFISVNSLEVDRLVTFLTVFGVPSIPTVSFPNVFIIISYPLTVHFRSYLN
jgi:hypothetical protein